jgi:hypothetical protein
MSSPSKNNPDDTIESVVLEKTKREPKIPVVKPDQGYDSKSLVNRY